VTTPEYWADYNNRIRRQLGDAKRTGVALTFGVQTSEQSCERAKRDDAERRSYGHNSTPNLPLPGCTRGLDCCCVLYPILSDTSEVDPAEVNRQYEATLAGLPPKEASAVRRLVEAALRGFGIKS